MPPTFSTSINRYLKFSLSRIFMTTNYSDNHHFLKKPVFQQVMFLIKKCCDQNGVDQSHGLPHAIDIACHVNKALQAREQKLNELESENVILAALLHDVDDKKYFKTSKGLTNAKQILNQGIQMDHQRFEDQQQILTQKDIRIDNILQMINLVAFSKNGNTINPQHPQHFYYTRYADRIDAIGIIGLIRCYQYSTLIKIPIYTQKTPKPSTKDQIYTLMQGRDKLYVSRGGTSQSVIDHIFDKLLHIKLPESIKNKYIGCLYQKGHDAIVNFTLKHATTGYVDAEKELIELVNTKNGKTG